jgi:hypothetical protein
MLMRSTGLGKTELVAEINDCKAQGDHLILVVNTTEPVKWKVRCTMTMLDMRKLIMASIKMSIVAFILNPLRWFKKEPEHPGEF